MAARLAALGTVCATALAAAAQVRATPPAPHSVPTLRGLAGRFLCTGEGRAYIIRLPDVALTGLSDQLLAGVANFVAFDLGAPVPSGPRARPYTAAEVEQLRERPLTGPGLRAYRAAVIRHLAARCAVPPGLRVYDK